jgi:hypothetical protein
VEHRWDDRHAAAVTIDLRHLGKVLEVDVTSRAARIEAGAFGPALEGQLKLHGLTLRHFPQSFEYSTLGGWIATRSGGHFASLYTHIDDLVENLRVVTPSGVIETRRLPGSGAGPSPDRMFIGSEGILGIISQAWMRLQSKPTFRAAGSVTFKSFFAAARAVRAIAQAGLFPSNCRILDAQEAYANSEPRSSGWLSRSSPLTSPSMLPSSDASSWERSPAEAEEGRHRRWPRPVDRLILRNRLHRMIENLGSKRPCPGRSLDLLAGEGHFRCWRSKRQRPAPTQLSRQPTARRRLYRKGIIRHFFATATGTLDPVRGGSDLDPFRAGSDLDRSGRHR